MTIIPVPPGSKPGPTTTNNKPSTDEQDEDDDDDDEDDDDCNWVDYNVDEFDGTDDGTEDFVGSGGTDNPLGGGGSGGNNGPGSAGDPTGAGTGTPGTATVTVTVIATPIVIITSTATIVVTRTSTPISSTTPTPPPTQPMPDPSTEQLHCYGSGLPAFGNNLQDALDSYCSYYNGKTVSQNKNLEMDVPLGFTEVVVGVTGRNLCSFVITESECKRIMQNIADNCKWATFFRIGGYVESNCATWRLDPNAT